jgi:predicted permease
MKPTPSSSVSLRRHLAVDLRMASRSLVQRPLAGGLIVLVLALMMGTATALFSLRWNALHHAQDVDAIDDLLMVTLPGAAYLEFRPRLRSFAASGFSISQQLSDSGESFYDYSVASVSPGWLQAVRPTFIAGGPFARTAGDPFKEAIISYRVWRKQFGGARDIVGRTIKADFPRRIVGVMSPGFVHPFVMGQAPDLWIPIGDESLSASIPHPSFDQFSTVRVTYRLAPGRTLAEGKDELTRLATGFAAQNPALRIELPLEFTPFAEADFSEVQTGLGRTLVAALVLLMVGGANIGAHLLSQTLRRRRENALALAVGGWPGRLVWQAFLADAVVCVAAGLLAAPVATGWMYGLKRGYTEGAADPGFLRAGLDGPVLLFHGVLLIVVIALIVLPTALHVIRINIHAALKSSARTHSGPRGPVNVREGLLALQVGLAAVLLTCAGIRAASIRQQLAQRGFDASGVVYARVDLRGDVDQVAFRSRVLAEAGALPGIEAAGLAWREPFAAVGFNVTLSEVTVADVTNPQRRTKSLVAAVSTGGDLMRTLRIPLLRGRLFAGDHDPRRGHEVVVDQFFQTQFLDGADPLGRTLKFSPNGAEFTIVGVVGRIKTVPVGDPARAAFASVYVPHREDHTDEAVTFLLRSQRKPAEVVADLQRIVRQVDPRKSLESAGRYALVPYRSVLGQVGRLGATSAFGLLALLLTALGLHSAASALVVSRSNEIGVRLAIGAAPLRVIVLLLRQGLRPISFGVAFALLTLAIGSTSAAFRDLVLEGEPLLWRWALTAVAIIALTTTLAQLAPAWRASRLSPLSSLRSE